jgi:hypothetical protein
VPTCTATITRGRPSSVGAMARGFGPMAVAPAPSRRVLQNKHSNRDKSMTCLMWTDDTDARRRKRIFNAGRVLVLNAGNPKTQLSRALRQIKQAR